MPKRLLIMVGFVSFALGMYSGLTLALPGRTFREKLEEGFCPLLDQPQTRFSESFREEVFRSLAIGSTETEVREALGTPLNRRDCAEGTTCWDYSAPAASDASHYVRVLLFDRSGHLERRYMGFVLGD